MMRGGQGRDEMGKTELNDSGINCLTKYMWMDYILWASRHPCGTVQKQTVAVCTIGNLRVCLCTADGLGQTCGLLSALVPTQAESTGYNGYPISVSVSVLPWVHICNLCRLPVSVPLPNCRGHNSRDLRQVQMSSNHQCRALCAQFL